MMTITEMTSQLATMTTRPLMPQEINQLSAELGDYIFSNKFTLVNRDNPTGPQVMIYFDHSANMFAMGDTDHKLETYISHRIVKTLVRCGII